MAFLSAYDPHEYSEAQVRALATGRDEPLADIVATVRQNLAGPTLQHLIVSAPRGFGKSFLMRHVQFEIERIARDESLPFGVVLMPEEMPHVKEPETLPRELARVLRGESGAAAELTWHEDDGEAWEEAIADLDVAVREKLGEKGLLVAIVENFDVLLRRAFGKEVQASRLRDWMARSDTRVMLLAASASGAFDRNYDDRLFQAFREVPLEPWSVDECMAFFDRQRREAGKPPLDEDARARARAVASFIGGAPRLAVLLGDALFDDDVLRAADLLDHVQRELTPYYKDRVEALPGRSQKLLDALLRFGEPATQTELAVRVKARSQTAIAEPFKDLVRERVVIGEKVEGSAEVRYRVADRIFAHYYRRRVVDHGAELCPLEAMVDLLADFYSPVQKAAKAGEFARAGRIAEARVMARLHDAETGGAEAGAGVDFGIDFADYHVPRRLAPLAAPPVAEALREAAALAKAGDVGAAYARLEATQAQGGELALLLLARSRLDAYEGVKGGLPAVDAASAVAGENPSAAALRIELENYRASSLGLLSRHGEALAAARHAAELAEKAGETREQAIATRLAADYLDDLGCLEEAVSAARRAAELAGSMGEVAEQAVATRLAAFSLGQLGRHEEAVAAARCAAEFAETAGDMRAQAAAARQAAFSLSKLGRHEKAVAAAHRAAELAETAGDVGEQAEATRRVAFSLGKLGRHEKAVAAARRAAELAETAGDVGEQAFATSLAAFSLSELGRHEEAVAAARRAAELAETAGDVGEQAEATRHAAFSLGKLGRHEEAVAAARRAAELAETAGDVGEQAEATRHAAFSLGGLGRHEEAVAAARRAAELAETAGDVRVQAAATRLAAFSLGELGRHEEAVAAARRAAELAETAGDVREQAEATRHAAFSLGKLGRHEEAVAAARRAAELAETAGDVGEQAVATSLAAFSLGQFGRHEEAVAAARRAVELAEKAGDPEEQAYGFVYLAFILADAGRPEEALSPLAEAFALDAANPVSDRSVLTGNLRYVAASTARRMASRPTDDGLAGLLAAAAPFDASEPLRAAFTAWMREFVQTALRRLSEPERLRLWADAVVLRFGDRFDDLVQWLRGAAEYHESGRAPRVLAKLDPDFAKTLELMFPPSAQGPSRKKRKR